MSKLPEISTEKEIMPTPAVEFTLYKGKVKGKFFPDSHIYFADGKRKTGVTTYLNIIDKSRPLIIWATELYRDYLLECLDNGWIEKYIKGEHAEMLKRREAQIAVNAFLDWEAANKVRFLSSERVVYSKKYDYIGKMDIETKVNGKLSMIDIKTSNGLYNTYGIQTAAYLKADEEESGREYRGRWLIRLAKETDDEYLKRMELKNINRQRKGKEAKEIPPYQAFEAKFLGHEEGSIDRDLKGVPKRQSLTRMESRNRLLAKQSSLNETIQYCHA